MDISFILMVSILFNTVDASFVFRAPIPKSETELVGVDVLLNRTFLTNSLSRIKSFRKYLKGL